MKGGKSAIFGGKITGIFGGKYYWYFWRSLWYPVLVPYFNYESIKMCFWENTIL